MVKDIPKWLATYLNLAGAGRIEKAVARAETSTSGEIVPLLVRRSTSVALVPLSTALFTALLAFAIEHSLGLLSSPHLLQTWLWIAVLLCVSMLGFLLGHLPWVQRLLLPHGELKSSAEQRALLEFYQARLNKTDGGTGILLFVSLLEHQAFVLADEGIAKHCQPAVFEGVVKALIEGAKAKDLASGYEKAIALCTEILTPYFPLKTGDVNELKDYLRIKE